MATRARRALLVPAFTAACAAPAPSARHEPPAPSAAAPTSPPSSAPPLTVPSTRPAPDVARRVPARFSEAFLAVARERGLAFERPVPLAEVDEEGVRARVRRRLAVDLPAHAMQGSRDILFGLGLVEPEFDFSQALGELYAAELMGLYDPEERTMYLKAGLGEKESKLVLNHELVHALQDQHYDLGKRVEWREGEGDRITAIHALAEGDATSAMMSLAVGPEAETKLQAFDTANLVALMAEAMKSPHTPGILQRSLIAPYIDGLSFVQALRKKGGWALVDAAWRDPPLSTEQLLHPDKYEAREAPEGLPVPTLAGLKLNHQDVLGEQGVRLILEEWLPRRLAARLASGWSGDRIAVLETNEQKTVLWHLRYDTTEAARDVAQGLAEYAPRRADGSRLPRTTPPRLSPRGFCLERPLRGPYAVLHSAREVGLVAGPFETPPNPAPSHGCSEALRLLKAFVGKPIVSSATTVQAGK